MVGKTLFIMLFWSDTGRPGAYRCVWLRCRVRNLQHVASRPFSSCPSLALTQNVPVHITHSNEKTWPSVDLAAGWISLTPTGCNVNNTTNTARCETDSEQYK
jgi:hypothetical protein